LADDVFILGSLSADAVCLIFPNDDYFFVVIFDLVCWTALASDDVLIHVADAIMVSSHVQSRGK